MLGRSNFNSSGKNGSLPFTVYQQLNEPAKKEGIWIKTDEKIKTIKYGSSPDLFLPTYEDANITLPRYFTGHSDIIDGYIYFCGGNSSPSYNHIYRINVENLALEEYIATPYSWHYDSAGLSIDKNFYIAGGYYTPTQFYQFNTETSEFTQLTNIPYNFANEYGFVKLNKDIYFFGSAVWNGYSSSTLTTARKTAYKYNVETNEFTKLTNIPFECSDSNLIFAYDGYIYLVYNSTMYRYDPMENTYTTINVQNTPVGMNSVIVNDVLYTVDSTNLYKYSLTYFESVYSSQTTFTSGTTGSHMLIRINDYILGTGFESNNIKIKGVFPQTDVIMISSNSQGKSNDGIELEKSYNLVDAASLFHKDNGAVYVPVYVGDGETWTPTIKFRFTVDPTYYGVDPGVWDNVSFQLGTVPDGTIYYLDKKSLETFSGGSKCTYQPFIKYTEGTGWQAGCKYSPALFNNNVSETEFVWDTPLLQDNTLYYSAQRTTTNGSSSSSKFYVYFTLQVII